MSQRSKVLHCDIWKCHKCHKTSHFFKSLVQSYFYLLRLDLARNDSEQPRKCKPAASWPQLRHISPLRFPSWSKYILGPRWSEDCIYYCSERNDVVVLFGTLKVQSFILTEAWVSDCGLLIVVWWFGNLPVLRVFGGMTRSSLLQEAASQFLHSIY